MSTHATNFLKRYEELQRIQITLASTEQVHPRLLKRLEYLFKKQARCMPHIGSEIGASKQWPIRFEQKLWPVGNGYSIPYHVSGTLYVTTKTNSPPLIKGQESIVSTPGSESSD